MTDDLWLETRIGDGGTSVLRQLKAFLTAVHGTMDSRTFLVADETLVDHDYEVIRNEI